MPASWLTNSASSWWWDCWGEPKKAVVQRLGWLLRWWYCVKIEFMTCQTWCFVFNCFAICRAGQRGGDLMIWSYLFNMFETWPHRFCEKNQRSEQIMQWFRSGVTETALIFSYSLGACRHVAHASTSPRRSDGRFRSRICAWGSHITRCASVTFPQLSRSHAWGNLHSHWPRRCLRCEFSLVLGDQFGFFRLWRCEHGWLLIRSGGREKIFHTISAHKFCLWCTLLVFFNCRKLVHVVFKSLTQAYLKVKMCILQVASPNMFACQTCMPISVQTWIRSKPVESTPVSSLLCLQWKRQ